MKGKEFIMGTMEEIQKDLAERIQGKKFSDLTEKEKAKEKARETFAALFEITDILAEEYEKEQEETQHDD